MKITCSGTVTQSGNNLQCSDAWLVSSGQAFDPSTLDPNLIAGALGYGFFSCMVLFSVVWGVIQIIQLVKRA